MVLAGGVLKLGILYVWNFGIILVVGIIVIIPIMNLIVVIDRKGFAAYSSVLHITTCVLLPLIVILLVRYIHIVLSPMIFMTVYIRYMISGNRIYTKIRVAMMILWMVNFGLPFLRGFFSEVYIILYNGQMLLMIIIIYMLVGYVMIKSLNSVGGGLFYLPWIVLYMLVV
jgi:hypothetical protein